MTSCTGPSGDLTGESFGTTRRGQQGVVNRLGGMRTPRSSRAPGERKTHMTARWQSCAFRRTTDLIHIP